MVPGARGCDRSGSCPPPGAVQTCSREVPGADIPDIKDHGWTLGARQAAVRRDPEYRASSSRTKRYGSPRARNATWDETRQTLGARRYLPQISESGQVLMGSPASCAGPLTSVPSLSIPEPVSFFLRQE